jgi:hypothetical protein
MREIDSFLHEESREQGGEDLFSEIQGSEIICTFL